MLPTDAFTAAFDSRIVRKLREQSLHPARDLFTMKNRNMPYCFSWQHIEPMIFNKIERFPVPQETESGRIARVEGILGKDEQYDQRNSAAGHRITP